jgi:hypothetical protein
MDVSISNDDEVIVHYEISCKAHEVINQFIEEEVPRSDSVNALCHVEGTAIDLFFADYHVTNHHLLPVLNNM